MKKDIIGKTVFRTIQQGYFTVVEEGKPLYTVEQYVGYNETLPNGEVNKDWYGHAFIKAQDGTVLEVPGHTIIVAPDDTYKGDEQIYHYLYDNQIYADVYTDTSFLGTVNVSISWGDWKHDHGWCVCLMGYIGYEEVTCEVTEENGSDTYSAVHKFLLKDSEMLKAIKAFRKDSNQ